ncbi:MAG: twin-arginine translocase TatA/TatE family subunit [Bacteriovoracaceae bacterium]|nr:twin-arginine translocase TatA/TatE family subunit [Bacteriovoracaceae bacterium]
MFGLGVGEIVVILFIALIFIGPKKLPELARGLGKGMREFQNAARGLQEHVTNPVQETKDQITDMVKPATGDSQEKVADVRPQDSESSKK